MQQNYGSPVYDIGSNAESQMQEEQHITEHFNQQQDTFAPTTKCILHTAYYILWFKFNLQLIFKQQVQNAYYLKRVKFRETKISRFRESLISRIERLKGFREN